MKQILSNLMNDESGQDLIEYALVTALVALGAVAVLVRPSPATSLPPCSPPSARP